MEKLYHISEASKLLGLTEKELNDLVEGKKIPHVVQSMTKMIREDVIVQYLHNSTPIYRVRGEGNKIENLDWVNPDEIK